MSIYHVDKLQCPVTLVLQDGLVREGLAFLSAFSPNRQGPQTLLELFNEPVPFLPFRKADESFSLVNKRLISHARFEPGPPASPDLGHPLQMRMVFAGGEKLQGTVIVAAPEGKNRLQDFLNTRQAFFQVDCGAAHYLVNPELLCEIAPA